MATLSAQDIAAAVKKPNWLRVDETDNGPKAAPSDVSIVTAPDRPRITLRIGVVGHRPGRLAKLHPNQKLSDTYAAIEAQLLALYKGINAATQKVQSLDRDGALLGENDETSFSCYSDDTPEIRVVAGTAYGADACAARAVQHMTSGGDDKPYWLLERIVPADMSAAAAHAYADAVIDQNGGLELAYGGGPDAETYAKHWEDLKTQADSITTLPASWKAAPRQAAGKAQGGLELPVGFAAAFPGYTPPPEGQTLDYGLAGGYQLRQLDILVVIWDKEAPRGKGGTGDIAMRANANGIPVIMIDAKSPKSMPEFMSRPVKTASHGGIGTVETEANAEALEDKLKAFFSPNAKGAALYKTYLKDTIPECRGPGTLDRFMAAFLLNVRKLCEFRARVERKHYSDKSWTNFIIGNPDEGAQSVRLKSVLHRRFIAADVLADKYARAYRSSVISTYLLSVMAVGLALMGLVFAKDIGKLIPIADGEIAVKAALVFAEIIVIFLIIRIVQMGRKQHYNQRVADYRALAESLRHLCFMSTFGEYAVVDDRSQSGWVEWYIRATARELGQPRGTLDKAFQSSLLRAVRRFEIKPQRSYHLKRKLKEHTVEHRLHDIGNFMFYGTAAVLIVYFTMALFYFVSALTPWPLEMLLGILKFTKAYLGLVAAFLPTFGGALAAIRLTLDFDGRVSQSIAMNASLRTLSKNARSLCVDLAHPTPNRSEAEAFIQTRAFLTDLVNLLSEDIAQFSSLYSRKHLTLPG